MKQRLLDETRRVVVFDEFVEDSLEINFNDLIKRALIIAWLVS